MTKKKKRRKNIKNTPCGCDNKHTIRSTGETHVPYFRGVFMRNTLPISGARRNESGIALDDARGPGTHWVTYAKRDNHAIYFDSFGNLRPPKELVRYFRNGVTKIEYNRTPYQTYDQSVCGQVCLQFLRMADSMLFNSVFDGFSIMSLTLTGKSNILSTIYFPTIDLSDDDYKLGLMNFETYNMIPNVNASNNKFYFDENDVEITILEGSFELS